MKLHQNAFITGIVAVSLTFSSCLETHVTNKVNSNGSVIRTVVNTSDNKGDFHYSRYPVPVNDTWQKEITFTIDSVENQEGQFVLGDDTTWKYSFKKEFESVDAINDEYAAGIDRYNKTKRTVEFRKRFRWFYSKVVFREKVEQLINGIDPKKYFTEEEYEVLKMQDHELIEYANHPDSIKRKLFMEQVEEKEEEWVTESLVMDYVNRLADYADSTQGSLDAQDVMERQDNIATIFDGDASLKEITEQAFNGDDLTELFDENIEFFIKDTEEIYGQLIDITGNGYTMSFEMPGTLISANGAIVTANSVQWNVVAKKFFATPYVMQAESRVMNIWAWIISAVFVVFVFLGLIRNKNH